MKQNIVITSKITVTKSTKKKGKATNLKKDNVELKK